MIDLEANKCLSSATIEALNHRDWEALQRLCSQAYVHHAPRVPAADLSTYIETASRLFLAFPDMIATVNKLVAEGEYVAIHYTGSGTHRGDFYGLAATGRTVSFDVIGMQRVVDGRIVEGWFEFDTGEIYAQLSDAGVSEKG
jgi:predicted ester cyclase